MCNHSVFGNVILVCIMVSSALLALEEPIPTAGAEMGIVGNSNERRERLIR